MAMKLTGSCHCGAVKIELPRKPRRLTSCNCSICRRIGGLWAYYQAEQIHIRHARGAVDHYSWGDKQLRFVRCATCGCLIAWQSVAHPRRGRMGINARNLDPAAIAGVRIRHLDGASTWKFLD
jgi:hypothetical protein